MKTLKYLVAGMLMFSVSANVTAQTPNHKEMVETITKALKADPSNPNAAKDLVKNYTKLFKKDPEALVALGNAYLTVKNYDKAATYADMALAKNKHFGNAYILKGDIGAMKDDGGEAAGWYQQAMQLDPKNPQGYIRYASVNRKVSPEESERALSELRRNVPDFPVEAEAAHTFYSSGNYEKAMEHFQKSDKSKLEEDRLAEYALTAIYVDNKEEGLAVAETGIRRFPENISFIRLALINALGVEKYDEALNYAKTLIAKEGDDNAGDVTYYGQALAGTKQYTEAIAQYEKALSLDSKNFRPYQLISEAYTGMGDEDKALEYSQKFLSLDPNAKPSDYNKLAGIYMEKVKKGIDKNTNFAKAAEVYDNLAQKFPQLTTWAHLQQANSAFMAEMDDAALPYYLKVISELEGKNDKNDDELGQLGSAYRNVGYIYWASKNDLETARPYFEKLLQIDSTNSLAKKALGLDQPAEEAAPAE